MKDHRNLLAAIPVALAQTPDAHFLLCGDGVEPGNPGLAPLAEPLGDAVSLLGRRRDVHDLLAAADLAVLSSASGEAMPIVIGEAMATGVPFVATDVADARVVIGDTGRVVEPRNPRALGEAIGDVLSLPPGERAALGEAARRRIVEHYQLGGMVDSYLEMWERAAPGG
jgi:glycosyltransferase involved in cell wall biosynthesis